MPGRMPPGNRTEIRPGAREAEWTGGLDSLASPYGGLISQLSAAPDMRQDSGARFRAMTNNLYGRPAYPGSPQIKMGNRMQNVEQATLAQNARQAQQEQNEWARYQNLQSAIRGEQTATRGARQFKDYVHGEEGDLYLKVQQMMDQENAQDTSDALGLLTTAMKIALGG